MSEAPQEVGSTANSYAILAKLATGGMAELFLARNASAAGIERYVVLKRVLGHKANDAAFVRMFLDEARLAAQLQHPNIAQVYDTGVLGDSYFFTMEYVHGETVREVMYRIVGKRQKMPIGCALTIAAGAAAGLHHAHERIGVDGKPLGIVHRDVSPSNLMVSFEGHVKIVDFGVAKATRRSTETESGTVKGKISYLSPEQCRGKFVDRRSDLFSLGIVLWEMLACERLFKRETDYENMDAICKEPTPSVRTVRPEVPEDVDAIVMKMLAKDPVARFQSADAVLEAIERVAAKAGIALSAASLSKFMRDVFGRRPEPWVQVLARDQRADAVTVTASPLGGVEMNAATSARLAQVPDLGLGREWPDASPGPLGPQTMTARARAASQPSIPISLDEDKPTTAASKSMAPRRGVRAGVIVAALLVAGAAAGGVWMLRGGGGEQPAADRRVELAPAAPDPEPAAAVQPEPAKVDPAKVDPAEPAKAEPPPQQPEPVEVAKPEPVESEPAKTEPAKPAPVKVASSTHATPKSHPHDQPHEPAHDTAADQLANAVISDHYSDAVAICSANPKLAAEKADVCAVSACRAHDAAKAKRWLALIGARREELVKACRAAGLSLDMPKPSPPKSDCDVDPMSCRH